MSPTVIKCLLVSNDPEIDKPSLLCRDNDQILALRGCAESKQQDTAEAVLAGCASRDEQRCCANALSPAVANKPSAEDKTMWQGCVGFMTAGGRAIAADKVRRQQAEALLAGCGASQDEQACFASALSPSVADKTSAEDQTIGQGYVGFMTAGGRAIAADQGRRQQAEALLAGCGASQDEQRCFASALSPSVADKTSAEDQTIGQGYVGFMTAGGRAIAADQGRRQQAEALLAGFGASQDEQRCFASALSPAVANKPSAEHQTTWQGCVGFMTAGGRAIAADQGRRQQAEALLAGCGASQDEQPCFASALSPSVADKTSAEDQTIGQGYVGFMTAGGRAIAADQGRRQQAEALLAGFGASQDEQRCFASALSSAVANKPSAEDQTVGQGHVGFMTAGGRAIAADQGRRQQAEALLAGCGASQDEQACFASALSPSVADKTSAEDQTMGQGHVGFTTAGGRAIAADQGRRQQAEALLAGFAASQDERPCFANALSPAIANKPSAEDQTMGQGHVGFTTAGGRAIAADQGRRQQAEALLAGFAASQDERPCFANALSPEIANKPSAEDQTMGQGHVGFTTAGGRAIAADQGRRQQAEALLAGFAASQDERPCFANALSPAIANKPSAEDQTMGQGHVGFTTAGGRAIAADQGRRQQAEALLAGFAASQDERPCFANALSPAIANKPSAEDQTMGQGHVGFTTAGGRAIAADQGRRQQAEALLAGFAASQDERPCFANALSPAIANKPSAEDQTMGQGHVGFTTAGGRAIAADQGRRQQAEALLAGFAASQDERPCLANASFSAVDSVERNPTAQSVAAKQRSCIVVPCLVSHYSFFVVCSHGVAEFNSP